MQKPTLRRARSFRPCNEVKYIPMIVSSVPENTKRKRISKFDHDKNTKTLPELIVGQSEWKHTHNWKTARGSKELCWTSEAWDHKMFKLTVTLTKEIVYTIKIASCHHQNQHQRRNNHLQMNKQKHQWNRWASEMSKWDVQAEPVMHISPAKRVSSDSKSNEAATVSSNRVTTCSGRTVKPNTKYAD